ncbi:hypothetical protein STRIC_0966 [Streptococcus ictaluri 707-05]|uniref:Uncharacterized protein n=1 Tax=Streptococcus ictaluri 707-05 TaxID=764299 RepID=G5K2F4_9STRE|nr:hypothetical protein STRIC_0966 [Streptococcus ictaluri 707-05]
MALPSGGAFVIYLMPIFLRLLSTSDTSGAFYGDASGELVTGELVLIFLETLL